MERKVGSAEMLNPHITGGEFSTNASSDSLASDSKSSSLNSKQGIDLVRIVWQLSG